MAIGFFGLSYFSTFTEQAGGVTANPERVFIELSKILFNPGLPACCSPPSWRRS